MPCTAHTLPAFSPHPGSSTVPADVEPVFKHTLLAGHSFSPFCYAFVQMFSTLPRPRIPMPIPMTFPMLHSIDYDQSSADSLVPIMIHDRRRSFKSNLISQLISQVPRLHPVPHTFSCAPLPTFTRQNTQGQKTRYRVQVFKQSI